ncbi:MAG: AAA family ATPase [Polyangiaceae bacterium]|nr:AAA family ATPase [Polyangiaceae bacterium]
MLSQLVGQPTARDTLLRAIASDHVHSAYLFDGPAGVGKTFAAAGLAQALLCASPHPTSRQACGACPSCVRIASWNATAADPTKQTLTKHPDLVILGRALYAPESIGRRTPETQEISIDQVRTLVLSKLSFAPHEGRARVFMICDADELSNGAANALLKTLEEPHRQTYFILLTSRPGTLLSTIRSRTSRVRFGPLPRAVLTDLLQKRGVTDAEAIARRSSGSLATAQELGDPTAHAARDNFVQRAKTAVAAPSAFEALQLAEENKKEKDALQRHLRSFACAVAEETSAANDPARSARAFSRILRAVDDIDRNVAAQLATESLFLDLRRDAP